MLLFILANTANTQVRLPVYPDSLFSTYYHQRLSLFRSLPQTAGDIIFMGNSITDGSEWSELFGDTKIKNRGISGDITAGVIHRAGEIAGRKPKKIFLMIGVNDLARGVAPDSVVKNILLLADYFRQETPFTQLYVQSMLPVNTIFGKFSGHTSKAEQIKQVNNSLAAAAAAHQYRFLDLYFSFSNSKGELDIRFSNDGLHLSGEGYFHWKHLVFPHVYDLQERASLIPQPSALSWGKEYFSLYKCSAIVAGDDKLQAEARQLQQWLRLSGWNMKITANAAQASPVIELRLAATDTFEQTGEAYRLQVSEEKITIEAGTPHGIFNGIQTLRQLLRDGAMADACEIIDRPAFSWRGYMIDVGRNYMPLSLLKEQLDVMAAYKLNVFHFHATEDIAWRIASRQYPQLTAPEQMLRNKGMYYTEAEIKELIRYCRDRHILFLPEIDMPGHSAAFKRAMKTDMQSDTGLQYVKNILQEFCDTYDLPFIHIGADEVKITNKNFIPEVTALLESKGKKVIGWQPGGNFSAATIRQLWVENGSGIRLDPNIAFIDSRHLYLNHLDPLEAVVTLFHRRIAGRTHGDMQALGGTICMWHDRAVAKAQDILVMNPVYPGMLTFAERSWKGGGQSGWIANVSDGDTNAFAEFENRLLDNRKQYFKDKPFAYTKQAGLQWKLYGPYANKGDGTKSFLPESPSWNENKSLPYKQVTGGTIVLRHWWAPLIKGAVDQPEEHTTFYATAKLWSDEAGEKEYWIGFNNLSRSPATDSPSAGAWDDKGSAVWVNGVSIAPPHWQRGGQKGNAEIPLTDEGYEYREPVKIYLQKGWNRVLIKAPVVSFKAKDWQNPAKWMFTFVELNNK